MKYSLFKRIKKVFITCLVITIAAMLTGCVFIIDDSQYYTGEELKELFQDKKESFEEITKILLGSDAFLEKMREEGDDDAMIYTKSDHKYFTNEEWEKIKRFFQDIRPTGITRDRDGVISFNFPQNAEGRNASLHYFNRDSDRAFRRYKSLNDSFEQIDEKWWLGETYGEGGGNN